METYPQIKICGLTLPEEAAATAQLGADAIGMVFYPPSPRHLSIVQAEQVAAALPDRVTRVGVFVNPEMDLLAEAIERCGLGIVQLHGNESPEWVAQISQRFDIQVIKTLFATRPPCLADAGAYAVSAFLVEAGKGLLPGGNAETWDWGGAAGFIRHYATALAGGLAPDNVLAAIAAALPDAVDASSGLESAPGRKDLKKVERFITAVRQSAAHFIGTGRRLRPVFALSDEPMTP
ncbi:MAG: phosphoribosylanthranilate isomerase [Desulfatitalea sp.]|nr:phosphoribosylanthranilate isomerase [Desulfatitalea sp.]NNJ99180.1 phosphoribosylanthranilate isomerase [Desulfatitalea sp.]